MQSRRRRPVVVICTVHGMVRCDGEWSQQLWRAVMDSRHRFTLQEECCPECATLAYESLRALWAARQRTLAP
jgi:hypothetical protein